jgi:transketolase
MAGQVDRGAYVLIEGGDEPDVVLIGTGSEVSICVEAATLLDASGVVARVVSMPSWDLFEEQDDDYQDLILGPGSPVLSVEAGTSFGWSKWADDSVSIDHFGASGPGEEVMAAMGFTAENVAARALALMETLEPFDDDSYDEEETP